MSASGSPRFVRWERAAIAWTPEGYQLTVPVFVTDERAALLLSRVLRRALNETDAAWTIQAGYLHRDDRGTETEDGVLTLSTPRLFDLDPNSVRELVNRSVETAIREAEEQQQRDEARSRDFLAQLRSRNLPAT